MKKQIYLVDVSSMYFRAFYAIRELTNSKGLPTNALYGFLSMTAKLIRDEKPDMMVYCFDSREPSFRREIYLDYKANRTDMPEALIPQVPYVRKLTDELGIPALQLSGYEADDLIGTLAKRAHDEDCDVWIVSGDKDFAQLVREGIGIYDTSKDVRLGEKEVVEKWGVRPDQFIDYLALVGDSSDNIPGVKGIGPKGAQKLLADYGTLDKIYENIASVGPAGVKKKLEESRELAFISQKLSRIHRDVPVDWTLDDGKLRPIDLGSARALLRELEFKGLEAKLLGTEGADEAGRQSHLTHIMVGDAPATGRPSGRPGFSEGAPAAGSPAAGSPAAGSPAAPIITPPDLGIPNLAAQFFNAPVRQTPVQATVETVINDVAALKKIGDGADVWTRVDSRGIFVAGGACVYFFETDLALVGRVLEDLNVCWHGWDLKTAFHALKLRPNEARRIGSDLMVASYLVLSTEQSQFADAYRELYKTDFPELPESQAWFNAVKRFAVDIHARLGELDALKLYREVELPLVSILYGMEVRGIRLDTQVLDKQRLLLDEDTKRIEKEVMDEVGEPFSLGSPKQLSHVLFEKLKMPVIRKTKTGFSTDSDVLEKLAVDYPICRKVISYRELMKLKSTYVDALPTLIDAEARLHTTFNQTMTTTGRLSSSKPNLQNIPIRTERGNAIRRAFVAGPGAKIISADYSQIELRLLAHITGDENMIRAFENDLDIHAATASEVFGVPLAEVNSELRGIAKGVNFGIAYGISAFGLSENLRIPRGEAQEIISRYFGKFPRIREFMDSTIERAKIDGFVTTLFNRRRYIPELASGNQAVKKFGERAAINAPIQGTAADIVKMAMVKAGERPELAPHVLLQVHDELILEVRDDDVHEAGRILGDVMANVAKLRIPLKVSVRSGGSWFEAH